MNDFFHIFGVAVFPIVCGFIIAMLILKFESDEKEN